MDKSENKKTLEDYKISTSLIYNDLAWGPLFRAKDGDIVKNTDNQAAKYILESLNIMKIPKKDLKGKKVFNIGTGRESRFFAENGSIVTHLDIAEDSVNSLKLWSKENKIPIDSTCGDIADCEIGHNKFDIIFLSGIYQHIREPAYSLLKFINALKPNGLMYMGFYRSGEFKYFIVDSIRHLIEKKMMSATRSLNAILFTLGEINHYQSTRVIDDFYVPRKHNFHPKDVIHDINLLGGEIYNFDNDLRDYNHEGEDYFSIGGDRIYITKKNNNVKNLDDVKDKLKTTKEKNQLFDIEYKEKIILENLKLIKKIKLYSQTGFVKDENIIALCLGLYQFTRPFIFKESQYFQESKKGRHKTLNKYLKNFIENFVQI